MKIKFFTLQTIIMLCSFNMCFAAGFQKSGEYFRYFEDDGSVARDKFVDYDKQKYYVNNEGYMVFSSWVEKDGNFYYASDNGAFYTNGVKTIDKYKYYFNEDGELQKGWVDDYMYYGDETDGFLVTGFQELTIPSDWVTEESKEKTGWFYFSSDTCKKYYAENDPYVAKSVGSSKYCFDQNGIIRTGWRLIKETTPVMKGYMYFSEETTDDFKYGEAINNTWYAIEPPTEVVPSGEVRYFYFNPQGVPRCAPVGKYSKVRIGEKTFLFNEYGYVVYGLKNVDNEFYYFGPSVTDCSMRTGIINADLDDSGEATSYYFEDDGRGFTGIYKNKLYYKGKLQMASKEQKYAAFKINEVLKLVNTSGTIMKNKKVTDGDGCKWTTNASGNVMTKDDYAYENDPLAPRETGNN